MKRSILTLLACQLCAANLAAAETMRAVEVIDGQPAVHSVAKPEPQAGQVRIKVRAASVNPVDWKAVAHLPAGAHPIPGRDLSGIIDGVGPDAGDWKTGQAVIAIAVGGSYAEYAIAKATAMAAKPQKLSFAEAAGIPVVGETAWRAMVTVANVQKGQRVLIQGGAGGVGSSAVQIAKSRGAYVIATASPSHTKLLRSLGADEVIDYKSVRFEDKVKDVDVVLNTVDDETGVRSVAVIRQGGILVSVVGPPPSVKCATAKIRCAITGPVNGEMLGALSDLAGQGKFHIAIEQHLTLADAGKAWDLNRAGHTGGKIILEVSR